VFDIVEQFVGLFVRNARVNDDLSTRLPIGGSSNPVLITGLKGIDDPKDLVELPTRGCLQVTV